MSDGRQIGSELSALHLEAGARLGDHFIELRKQAFKNCFPASALITITGLAQPGLLVEIQGIAVVGGK